MAACVWGVILRNRMSSRPFSSRRDRRRLILLPALGYVGCQWIVWIWSAEKGLNREKNGSDLKSWGPVALENIQADTAELVNIWMVYLGKESDLWWCHRIVVWQKQFEIEYASFIWRLCRAMNLDIEISQIIIVRHCADTRNWLCHQPFRLLDDTLG